MFFCFSLQVYRKLS